MVIGKCWARPPLAVWTVGSIGSLQNAVRTVENAAGEELVVVELKESLEHLGRMLGDVFTDDILDRIFSNFCIGK